MPRTPRVRRRPVPVAARVGGAALLVLTLSTLVSCSAWRVVFPARTWESEPPAVPERRSDAVASVLLFTKTNGFRHHEAIDAGVPFFEALAQQRGWQLFHTENGAVHTPELLARFDAVVWFQTSGDTLDPEQKAALRRWIHGGGGFVGVHNAGGDFSYDWTWYVDDLIGARFVGHIMSPQFQEARVDVEDREHPATAGLPQTFRHTEEWYSFESSPRARGARVLLSVDEGSYAQDLGWLGWFQENRLTMGDHPVVWSHCPGSGRALYSALGHRAESYASPEHRSLLEGAIVWAAGLDGRDCKHTLAPVGH